jgi:hypothetical protein
VITAILPSSLPAIVPASASLVVSQTMPRQRPPRASAYRCR